MEERKQEGAAPARVSAPLTIVVAGAVISLAILFSAYQPSPESPAHAETKAPASGNFDIRPLDALVMKSVSDADRIMGDRNAPVKIVEYSDLECPFCKRFHPELQKLVNNYHGQVAWVYRQFPIDQLHVQARTEAESAECVFELGGNDAFWKYISAVYEITPSNDGLDLAILPVLAQSLGLDRQKFSDCLAGGKHKADVEASVQDAVAAGARGTPYSVIVTKSGKFIPFNGALSADKVKMLLDTALAS